MEAATQTPWAVTTPQYPQKYNTDTIAVFGTTRTIASHAYPEEIRKRCPKVAVVQHPETSYAEDVNFTKAVIDRQDGPVVLVGHSYGGAVITEAGNHPKVAALVYIAAFALDAGESLGDEADLAALVAHLHSPSIGDAQLGQIVGVDLDARRSVSLTAGRPLVERGVEIFS